MHVVSPIRPLPPTPPIPQPRLRLAPRNDPDALPCQVEDLHLWFSERPADLERAKEFCCFCPVRLACLEGALQRRESCGVWGGQILENGVVIARKRPRGRPRKDDSAAA